MSDNNTAGEGNALHGDLAASLEHAHLGLQGLLALLRGSAAGTVPALSLAVLLIPLADQVDQARAMAQALVTEP